MAVGDGSVTANFAVTLPCCQWLLMGCWLVYTELFSFCSVLNKLTLQKSKIKMKYSKKQYNYYSDDERMSYIREYLSSP
ncbi:hypothetical protein ACMSDP_25460, partial [Bacteroides thetaiotaomicron]